MSPAGYAKNFRSPDVTAVMMSRTQKISVPTPVTNCRIPAIQCPLMKRVIAPRIQLVTGMIAKMMVMILPRPRFR